MALPDEYIQSHFLLDTGRNIQSMIGTSISGAVLQDDIELLLRLGGGRQLSQSMEEFFPGLPIILPPLHRSSRAGRPSGWWMKNTMVRGVQSSHSEMRNLAELKAGRVQFGLDEPVLPRLAAVCMTSPGLERMHAAWILIDRTAALVRLQANGKAEAALLVLSLRPLRLRDQEETVSVNVTKFNGNSLVFRFGDRRWNIAGYNGMIGSGHDETLSEALKIARGRLNFQSETYLRPDAARALKIWTSAMEIQASHLLNAWEYLPHLMTLEEYRSLPPYTARR